MMPFIFFSLTIIIAFFLFSALILFGLTKLFKVQNATYKNSIKILLFFSIVSFFIGAFFNIFNNFNFLIIFIEAAITFFVFHYFLKRYYQNSFKKSLGIYIAFFILTITLSLGIIMPIRHFLVEPFYVKGDEMNPTLIENDYLLTDKFNNNYQKGNIIVFNHPEDAKILIRRITNLSGETDEYFVAGDNEKTDFNLINEKDIIGKVFLVVRDSKIEFVK